MKLKCTMEFVEKTIDDLWPTYELFDQQEKLIGKLYLKKGHLPPEFITLYLEDKEDE